MSKVVSVSDDSGATWDNIPGPEASFSIDGDQIDDSILGQKYESGLTGILSWAISANGYYKGLAGYVADLKKSGTSTSTTGEAMSLVSGKTYSIDDTTKEVWDFDSTITVYDGVTDVTAQVDSYDYLFGQVTFDSGYSVVGAVTIDVNYYPMATFGKARNFSLTQTANALDTSDYQTVQANSGYRTHAQGLRTVNLELGGIFNASDDWKTELANRQAMVIEINPDGNSKSRARGWFRLVNTSQDGSVGDNEMESVSFVLNVASATVDPFAWKHEADTTLADSIQKILTAFEDELDLDVRYLYDGTNGVKGTTVVTEATLSGDIEGMNEFSFNFQSDGAWTAVP